MKKFYVMFAGIFLVALFLFPQSKETGALKGTITLEDGNSVPGVLVTLSSKTVAGATQTTISNENGQYRFVALLPGVYTVSASLGGFSTAIHENIKVYTGRTFTVDLALKQGKIVEEILVEGKSASVDIKDSSVATFDMTTDFLKNIPNSQESVNTVNLAPGIINDVAYGATAGTGVSYQVDGVDVSDPASGVAWVFLDYHVVEEVSISGIGAPAEYGGFTGVVFNTVTKSGTNQFKGYSEFMFQGKSWNSSNSDDPNFAPGKVEYYSGHIDFGGPIIKDELTFFASFLYAREKEGMSGTDYDRDFWQPKGFLKLNWTPNQRTRFHVFGEYDVFNGVGRGGNALTLEEATSDQDSPEGVVNVSVQHLFSDYSFMEAKVAYFDGFYALEPHSGRDVSGHVDNITGQNTVNAAAFYRGDRSRLQANASVSHHADDFLGGSHDFKFGAEYIHVAQRDQYGYTNGRLYLDNAGEPSLAIDNIGTDIGSTLNTVSFYVQDSWTIGNRLTINPGARIDISWGGVDDISGNQYAPKPGIAPRIGFSYDVFGDHTTAFKGHWGRYYEGAYIDTFKDMSNSRSDVITYLWDDSLSQWQEVDRLAAGVSQYIIDEDLKQAYMDQLTFGIQRQLFKDWALGVTYIHRKNHNLIAPVDIGGQYIESQYTDDTYTGQTFTVWEQLNDRSQSVFLITNPKAGEYDIVQFTPYRKYSAVEVLLNKRFSDNWQLMASYVYSRTTGNVDNDYRTNAGVGRNQTFESPNLQINADGRLTHDPTHMFKVQGSIVLPYGFNVNASFHVISGNTYTRKLALPYAVDANSTVINVEPQGSNRYDTSVNLDLRLEKTFKLGEHYKVGFILDVFNVFNEGIVTEYEPLVSATGGNNELTVLAIQKPRAFRAGLRFWF